MTPTPRTRPVRSVAAQGRLRRRALETPIGPLLLVASDAGVRAVLWPGEDGARVRLSLDAVATGVAAEPPSAEGAAERRSPADDHLDEAAAELTEYFAGTRLEFDVTLDPVGTPFQQQAWQALRAIPYGRTITYGEQAVVLGDPRKARAVGGANRGNPISVIVPCHRVVGRSGALTGFAGGLDTKAWLLAHEQRVLAAD